MGDSARFSTPGTVIAGAIAAAYFANWATTDWYLDSVVGDDMNPGTTAALPLRTGAELLRRLGGYAIWQQSVTIHILENGMTDDLILIGVLTNPGDHLDVLGVPTTVADVGTIASFTAPNHATPEASLLQCTGVADWSAMQWMRLRITAGAREGAIAWIAVADPEGLYGVSTARTSRWTSINAASSTVVYSNVTPVNGDPVVVETLPPVPSIAIYLDGAPGNQNAPGYPQRQVMIRDVAVRCCNVWASGANDIGRTLTFGIEFSTHQTNASTPSSLLAPVIASLCSAPNPGITTATSQGFWVNCLVGKGLTFLGGAIAWGSNALVSQACSVSFGQAANIAANDLQVFDVVGATSSAVGLSGYMRGNNMSGRGNAGYGLGVFNGSGLRITGTLNIQGAVSDVRLLSTTATSMTLPQFVVGSDWAQKGTATLAGGTVAVAVPYWDPTRQSLNVSYNTPNPTPGYLSAPSASRTTAGFVINSSVPADAGTVDWQISPLGRNIFFSST